MFQIPFFKYHFPKEREHILFILMSSIMPMVFPVVIYGYEKWTIKKVDTKELILLSCGVGEDSEHSLDCKEIKPVYPKGY